MAEPYRHPRGGRFTFQVTLHANGDVVFVYVDIPELLTSDALYDHEPVAGLSDAFLLGDSELHVYHTVNVDNPDIVSGAVVVFKAQETCVRQKTCSDCLDLRFKSGFGCTWCEEVRRCSDGADRLRESWNDKGCVTSNVSDVCTGRKHMEWRTSVDQADVQNASASVSAGVVISGIISAVLIVVLAAIGLGFVFVYGRSHPGGIAEVIALRLERNYKRFHDGENNVNENNNNNNDEESGPKMLNNNTDSRNITVSF